MSVQTGMALRSSGLILGFFFIRDKVIIIIISIHRRQYNGFLFPLRLYLWEQYHIPCIAIGSIYLCRASSEQCPVYVPLLVDRWSIDGIVYTVKNEVQCSSTSYFSRMSGLSPFYPSLFAHLWNDLRQLISSNRLLPIYSVGCQNHDQGEVDNKKNPHPGLNRADTSQIC